MAPRRRRAIDKLPEAFKACKDGWTLTNSHEEPVKLMTEDEFSDKFLGTSLKDTYLRLVDSVEATLKHDNKDVNSSVDAYEALLSNIAIEKIVGHTNQALYNSGLTRTDAKEYRKFLALRNLVSRFRCPVETVWSDFLPHMSRQHGIQFMDLGRFRGLLFNTRGYAVRGRSGSDDDTWMQRKQSLRFISDLEKEIYAPSASMFINKTNGVQARTIIKPYIYECFKRNGRYPSVLQMRRQAWNLTVDEYLYGMSIQLLQEYERRDRMPGAAAAAAVNGNLSTVERL
jgi:hypothetical protein